MKRSFIMIMSEVMNIITAIHYWLSLSYCLRLRQTSFDWRSTSKPLAFFYPWSDIHYFCAMHVSSKSNMAPEKVSSCECSSPLIAKQLTLTTHRQFAIDKRSLSHSLMKETIADTSQGRSVFTTNSPKCCFWLSSFV